MIWPTKKLGEICEVFTDGDWIESKDQSSSGVRLIQTGNVGEGVFLNKSGKSRYVSEQTFEELDCTEIFSGDILISRLPDPVGRSCIIPNVEERMITAVDCTIIRVKKDNVLPEYLLFFTNSPAYYAQVRRHLSGTTRQRISRGNLATIEIPLPPLSEQKKIVAKLEKLLGKIKEAKRLRAEAQAAAKDLLSAELHKIFSAGKDGSASGGEEGKKKGWEELGLGKVVKLQGGFAFKSSEYLDQGVPLVRIQNLKNGGLDLTKAVYLSEKCKKEFVKFLLKDEDILVAMSGATTGKMARVSDKDLPAFLNQRVGRFLIINEQKLNKRFLWYFLKTLQTKFLEDAYGGAQPNISPSKIENMNILLPPLAEQKKIVARLDSLSAKVKQLQEYQQSTAADLTALEQSILSKAFSN